MSYIFSETPDGFLGHDEELDNNVHILHETLDDRGWDETDAYDHLTTVLDVLADFEARDSDVLL